MFFFVFVPFSVLFDACHLGSNIVCCYESRFSSSVLKKNRVGVPKRQFSVVWNTQHCAGEKRNFFKCCLYGIVNPDFSTEDVFHNRIRSKKKKQTNKVR